MKELLTQFASPGMDFRGVSFWAWNGFLSQEELIRQIHLFKKMGMGGFFMHSRVGLATPYLSREWFDCIRTCVNEASKLGMQAWIYDEDRWPSGAAGGIVTKEDRFREKKLTYEILESGASSNGEGTTLAYFEVFFDKQGQIASSHRVSTRNAAQQCIRFYWRYAAKTSWFNGETYLDTLNTDAVQKFIQVTHQAYLREVGNDFGKAIPGFFTDEPCITHFDDIKNCLPWTTGLETLFETRYGYDLCEHLPELFFAVKDECTATRWHYRSILTQLFVNAFSKTIGEWCEKNHVQLTGHVLAEDLMFGQTLYVGSAMRFYEHMQIPGVDLLTEHWNTYATTKQCTSVARQFGKRRRFCECYGCTGWDFPLAGHKALGDWLYALGINGRCMHLAWYTMEGEAKRDFPASISYHSPWYKVYNCIEDYFARLGAVLTGGDEKRDILLIHAVESYWCMSYQSAGDGSDAMVDFEKQFIHVYNRLLSENLDFDFGDEEHLSRIASVDGGLLRVGKATYRAVVIPKLKTIRSTTLALLKKFSEAGGAVFAFGEAPRLVNAMPSENAAETYRLFHPVTPDNFIEEIARKHRIISLTTPDGKEAAPLLFHLAEKEDVWTFFIVNTSNEPNDDFFNIPPILSRTKAFPDIAVEMNIPYAGELYELNPANGQIMKKNTVYNRGCYRFQTSFAPLESRLFIISPTPPPEYYPPQAVCTDTQQLSLANRTWKYRLHEDNVLILDHARYRIGTKPLSDTTYILQIDNEVRKQLGVPKRGENMVQPWLVQPDVKEKQLTLFLEYTFSCDSPPKACHLVLEHPEHYAISLNGKALEPVVDGWWADTCLKRVPIPQDFMQKGTNILDLECSYRASQPGLEAMFLQGAFGVQNDVITLLPSTLEPKDLCTQGLPYYAGNITYVTTLSELTYPHRQVLLDLPHWRGAALGVRVNGSQEQILAWPPYRLDATSWLKYDGGDVIEITVYGHRRNAFGPFYDKESSPVWCSSKAFYAQTTTKPNLVPFGIIGST